MKKNTVQLAIISLIVANLFWGATSPIIKIILLQMPPFTLLFFRFALATLLLSPLFILKPLKIERKDLLKVTIITFLGPPLTLALFFAGIDRTSAVDAGIVQNILPIISLVGAYFLLKEKVNIWDTTGAIIAFFGSLVIIGQPLLNLESGDGQRFLGNILMVLSLISWVLFTIFSKKYTEKYDITTLTLYSFLLGIIFISPLSLLEFFQNSSWPSQVSLLNWLGVIFLAVFPTIISFFLYEWALEKVDVKLVVLFNHLQPLVTIALAVFLLKETIDNFFIFGSILIIGGVLIATHNKPHHHKLHSRRI